MGSLSNINPLVHLRDLSERRRLGAYYTPLRISRLLATWGIRRSTDRVLEPCFGGCTFIEAAIERLWTLDSTCPERNLHGFDIDPRAFEFLTSRTPRAKKFGKFVQQDFLKTIPTQFKTKVDFVVGNPPYISYENLDADTKKFLLKFRGQLPLNLDGRSSLWAYFVLHSLSFLKRGGRLALVLPGSFIFAEYAQPLHKLLSRCFKNITAVKLTERLFLDEGTDETTVLLLGDGYQLEPLQQTLSVLGVDTVDELEVLVRSHDMFSKEASRVENSFPAIPHEVLSAYEKLKLSPDAVVLGSITEILIGLVTGDSDYFIKSASEWRQRGIGKKYLRYVVPRSKYVRGIRLTSERSMLHIEKDFPCLGLSPPVRVRSKSLMQYLISYPKEDRDKNITFAKRPIWYNFYDGKVSDGFLVFMTGLNPRLIVNECQAHSTNGYYRVFLKPDRNKDLLNLAAISIHSTFSQMSAEVVGHARGAGALKLEPSKAKQLYLLLPKRSSNAIKCTLDAIDLKLSLGDYDAARMVADEFLFGPDNAPDLKVLLKGLEVIRSRRVVKANN